MSARIIKNITAVITAAVVILAFYLGHSIFGTDTDKVAVLRAGFVFDGDDSTPYTANFVRSVEKLRVDMGDNVDILIRYNVSDENSESMIRDLAEEGCDIIFTASYGYGEYAKKAAADYPNIQFCQATCSNANEEPFCGNYHTFMGEICEGRYVTGKAAGLKLNQLIDEGIITPDQAVIGYVGAYRYAEVVSGYTSFLLGARSVCPTAVMKVKYIDSWMDFALEQQAAYELIDEGCVIISQDTDTIGPALVCEKRSFEKTVYHIGYNQDMSDVAPTTSITSTRIVWTPYIIGACHAVYEGKDIEKTVGGHRHGNDLGAGFKDGWVEILKLNDIAAAPGTGDMMKASVRELENGNTEIFKGNYRGINPYDENDVIDLNYGYKENEKFSAPMFCYILDDIVTEELE